MAMTSAQKEALTKAIFYSQQDPAAVVELLDDLISSASGDGESVTIDNTLTKTGQAADAKVTGDKITTLEGRPTFTKMATQADSTATGTDVDTLKTDFNSLLSKLKTAGLMTQ